MKKQICKFLCIAISFFFIFVLSTVANAAAPAHNGLRQFDSTQYTVISENTVSLSIDNSDNINMNIITNPTIVSDGRDCHQLSSDILIADTETLLQAVLNSEYIRIAQTSAILLSSSMKPLSVNYSLFNGYTELLTRSDLESTLLSYISNATPYELSIIQDILQREDFQSAFPAAAPVITAFISSTSEQTTYVTNYDSSWSDISNTDGISYTLAGTITFIGGQQINAYQASREYSAAEAAERDARTAALNLPITLIHSADASYNCHSYAWYLMSNSNPYWIGIRNIRDEGFVIGDQMLIPTTASNVENDFQVKDIVVYYDEDGKILHSAVIMDIDGDTITLQSKWGQCGVYRHELSTVPLAYLGADGVLRYKVYRYHNYVRTSTDLGHSLGFHNYQHTDTCSICGYTIISTERLICGGPPCAVPFSYRP